MLAAMMLPTTLPLLQRFDRLAAARGRRVELIALLVAGYLLVWLGFGIAAHLLDEAINTMARRSEWLMLNAWALGAGVLAIAGLFQFSVALRTPASACSSVAGSVPHATAMSVTSALTVPEARVIAQSCAGKEG